jgi:hypothetical protein
VDIASWARRALAVAVVMGGLAFAGGARANVLQTTGWLNGHEAFDVTGGPYSSLPVGGFTGKWNGVDIVFWCVELSQFFNPGTSYPDYTASPLNNSLLSALFQEAIGQADDSPDNSAAFQLAVWEIMFEGGSNLDVTSGNFRVTNAHGNTNAVTTANYWLTHLPQSSNYSIYFLYSPGHQNFITANVPPSKCCGNVPEPAPLALLGAAVGAWAITRRVRAWGSQSSGRA